MKSFITLLALIFISLFGESQETFPFPDSNAIWVNTYYDVIPNQTPIPSIELAQVVNYCMNGMDTVINSHTYSQVYICDSVYKGAIREINQKVFFIPRDSVIEFLLYDFSAIPGDTLHNIYMEEQFVLQGFLDDVIIQQVDSVLMGNDYRKRLFIHWGTQWIEGIGCAYGLFMHPFLNVSHYKIELHCMSTNDTTLYPDFSSGACSLSVGIDEINTLKPKLALYPNPSDRYMFVSLSNGAKIEAYHVLNQFGQIVKTEKQWQNPMDISVLKSGLYIIQVKTQNSIITERFIKY